MTLKLLLLGVHKMSSILTLFENWQDFLDIQYITFKQGAHCPTLTQLIFRFFLIAANATAFPESIISFHNVIFYFQLILIEKNLN